MEKLIKKIKSECDGLELELEIIIPTKSLRGIVQISHGMSEHKERYEPFMDTLAEAGYVTVIHDHRGHGESIKQKEDLGYFYTKDEQMIVKDLHQVTLVAKEMFPNLPLYLFSHSMGTLVARNYLKLYDSEVDKVVLCGPPVANALLPIAFGITYLGILFRGEKSPGKFIDKLTFSDFGKNFSEEAFSWICSDESIVEEYNRDEKCGFVFSYNGFLNLFRLTKNAFAKKAWCMKNPALPIFVIAGEQDPVIRGEKHFLKLVQFMKDRGYSNIQWKLYKNKRHELLNETGKEEIYQDVILFFDNKQLQ